ncbi:MAG: relaxase/mobilization nuclease domain-containing protein [Flammeovirgaceae bacterium]
MIIKVEYSASATVSDNYINRNPTAKLLYSSLGSEDPSKQAELLELISKLGSRGDMRQRFIHLSVSFPPKETLLEAEITMVSRIVVKELFKGISPLFFCIYSHSDKDHKHTHCILSRISLDRNIQKVNYADVLELARRLENELSLIGTSTKKSQKRITTKIAHALIHNYDSQVARTWEILDDALKSCNSLDGFQSEIQKHGIDLQLKQKGYDYVGITYSVELEKALPKFNPAKSPLKNPKILLINGSRLGIKYTIKEVLQRLELNKRAEMDANKSAFAKKVEVIVSSQLSFYDMMMEMRRQGIDFAREQKSIVFFNKDQSILLPVTDLAAPLSSHFLWLLDTYEKELSRAKKQAKAIRPQDYAQHQPATKMNHLNNEIS